MDRARRVPVGLLVRMVAAVGVVLLAVIPIVLVGVLLAGVLGWVVLSGVYTFGTALVTTTTGESGSYVRYTPPLPTVLCTGVALGTVLFLVPARNRIRRFRIALGTAGDPAETAAPELVDLAGRIAQQADVPPPELRIVDRERPASYAIGGRSDGRIVITRGLVEALSEAELAAVLAHESSHLLDGDSRVLGVALVATLVAEQVRAWARPSDEAFSEDPLWAAGQSLVWVAVTVVTAVPHLASRFGVALLSRGREYAADSAAARLIGSPAAVASALRTLSGTHRRPAEDLRTWTQSASALEILPTAGRQAETGLLRTHPDTERRIRRLEEMAAEFETTAGTTPIPEGTADP